MITTQTTDVGKKFVAATPNIAPTISSGKLTTARSYYIAGVPYVVLLVT